MYYYSVNEEKKHYDLIGIVVRIVLGSTYVIISIAGEIQEIDITHNDGDNNINSHSRKTFYKMGYEQFFILLLDRRDIIETLLKPTHNTNCFIFIFSPQSLRRRLFVLLRIHICIIYYIYIFKFSY